MSNEKVVNDRTNISSLESNRLRQIQSHISLGNEKEAYKKASVTQQYETVETKALVNGRVVTKTEKVLVNSRMKAFKPRDNLSVGSGYRNIESEAVEKNEKSSNVEERHKGTFGKVLHTKGDLTSQSVNRKKNTESQITFEKIGSEPLKPVSRIETREKKILVGGKIVTKIEKIVVNDVRSTKSVSSHESKRSEEKFQNVKNTTTNNLMEGDTFEKSLRGTAEMSRIDSKEKKSMSATSGEFMKAISNTSIDSQVEENRGYHRRNVISSSAADINNVVLHRKGTTSALEAQHRISSAASVQRKSINNLSEIGQYISNSSQSNERKSLSSLHRQSVSPTRRESTVTDSAKTPLRQVSHWSNSLHLDDSLRSGRTLSKDNLVIGTGKYLASSSESKVSTSKTSQSLSSQTIERKIHRSNTSHISFGDTTSSSFTSLYRNEFTPRHSGPCPASFIETTSTPFKHTRDTRKHKYYLPVVDTK